MSTTTAAIIRTEIDRLLADTTMTAAEKEVAFNTLAATARAAKIDISEPDEETAWDRAEDDYCERGTQGCSVHHTRESECATW